MNNCHHLASVVCLSVVMKLQSQLEPNLQEWCLIGPLPISSFRHDLAKTMGTHDNSWFWLTGTLFKSSSRKLQFQMIYNREQMMFAKSSTKITHFRRNIDARDNYCFWLAETLRRFSSETTKLDDVLVAKIM
jgi:hypothetical protein